MPSLIDIRRRIRSVKSTQQITRAMKMVSAAKLRRAQDRCLAARPYAAILREVLADVAEAASKEEALAALPLLAVRPEDRILLILLTADRGLAGAFNSNLIKAAQKFLQDHAGKTVELEVIGRKGRDFFRRRPVAVSGEHLGVFGRAAFADAQAIGRKVCERYANAEIDAVYLLFNEFKSMLAQKLTLARVLPIVIPPDQVRIEYIYEQSPRLMLDRLLPNYVEVEIYHAILESAAAEHAARMTAMDAATTNASEMIDHLTLYMNRVRQASITKEIIEVVSGAAALE